MKAEKMRFTKHASEKFAFLSKYGFNVTEAIVRDAVGNPDRVEQRGDQTVAMKSLDDEFALRVVYKRMNDNIVVVTFYPVRRERFNV